LRLEFMPDTLTWGLLLMLAALIAAAVAVARLLRWFRQREHGRGTPQYADARLARRAALYALAIGIVLFAAGWLTPLWDSPVA
jgi:hypothetical protein